jgi:hypothetical protein
VNVVYAKAFFDLQIQFAQTVSGLAGWPLPRVLLEYTNLYIRFGLGRDFDPAHPLWREYLAGLGDASDGHEWTYRFYLRRPPVVMVPNLVATSGCFSYASLDDDRIRLHFHNTEPDNRAPLGIERQAQRLADLTALFARVKCAAPPRVRVVGASWLYNLEAYRRLFPKAYLATAHAIRGRFRHMPLWGQFVDRSGEVRPSVAREFLDRLARQSSLEGLERCFPLQVLGLEAPAREFYEFYGV